MHSDVSHNLFWNISYVNISHRRKYIESVIRQEKQQHRLKKKKQPQKATATTSTTKMTIKFITNGQFYCSTSTYHPSIKTARAILTGHIQLRVFGIITKTHPCRDNDAIIKDTHV